MRIVLVGAPGSGKGTQGRALAERLGVPYIGTGEALRARAAAGDDVGRRLAPILDRGELVPDGLPRTRRQARDLESVAAPDAVVFLDVPDEVARRRLAARAEGRSDDVAATVEDRLNRFQDEIEPLLDFYDERGVLTAVDADRPPDVVSAAILEALAGRPGRIP
jgi:adenylate kinase